MSHTFTFVLLVIVICLGVSCRTPIRSAEGNEALCFSNKTACLTPNDPKLNDVSTGSITDHAPNVIVYYSYPSSPHVGRIVRTNSIDPNTLIHVNVCGAVKKQGMIQVPKGTTILEAIKQAGGFEPRASQKITLRRDNSFCAFALQKEKTGSGVDAHVHVWFGASDADPTSQKKEVGAKPRGDVVLEADDLILVPEAIIGW